MCADHTFGYSKADTGCSFHWRQREELDLSLPTHCPANPWVPSGSAPPQLWELGFVLGFGFGFGFPVS